MKRKRVDADIIKTTNRLSATDFKQRYFDARDASDDDPTPSATVTTQPSTAIQLYTSPAATHTSTPIERLPDAILESCLSLLQETSEAAYRASAMGWHKGRKRREMRDRDMRYLVIGNTNGGPDESAGDHFNLTGFSSFMFTYEDGIPVVYIYEIHLAAASRGMGHGRRLMDAMEKIAQRVGVEKTMLTVYQSNTYAIKWYEQLGYGVDEYSPPDKRLRGEVTKQADYQILSKPVKPVSPKETSPSLIKDESSLAKIQDKQ